MSEPVIDNATTQITDKGLIELVARLSPFFKSRPRERGAGLPVPPWTVNYATGEVTGRVFEALTNKIALVLDRIGEFALGNGYPVFRSVMSDGTEDSWASSPVAPFADATTEVQIRGESGSGAGQEITGQFNTAGTLYGQVVTLRQNINSGGSGATSYGLFLDLRDDGTNGTVEAMRATLIGVGQVAVIHASATGSAGSSVRGSYLTVAATGDFSTADVVSGTAVATGDNTFARGVEVSASAAGANATAYAVKALASATGAGSAAYSAYLEGGSVEILLGSGGKTTVRDSSGNQIFRVDDDGSVHISVGQTIVADL